MAATVWKGYLTFGLISIPVRLFTAARAEHVAFHMIHEVCGTRVREQLYCPHCERTVERSEIVKGYESEKDQYVIVSDDELKKIAPATTGTMEILQFTKLSEIDPLYYEASYYVAPEEPGRKAYQLLLASMNESGYAAVAKVAMHQREHIVVIRPRESGMALHTIYYPHEVRAVPEVSGRGAVQVQPKEIQLARQLVESLAAPFEPQRYEDEYEKRVLELIEAKSKGKTVAPTPQRKAAPVIDLMEALKKSLAAKPARPAAKSAEREKAPATPHLKGAAAPRKTKARVA